MFKIDYSDVGGLVEPGEYEVIPTAYDITTSQNGNQKVTFNYEIRSDVPQNCQGLEIKFDNFTVTQNAKWRFNAAAKAAGIPDGTEFNSIKDWAEAFKGRPIRVVVGEREYNGKTYPQVNQFKETETVGGPPKNDDPFGGNPIDISDGDLPF